MSLVFLSFSLLSLVVMSFSFCLSCCLLSFCLDLSRVWGEADGCTECLLDVGAEVSVSLGQDSLLREKEGDSEGNRA